MRVDLKIDPALGMMLERFWRLHMNKSVKGSEIQQTSEGKTEKDIIALTKALDGLLSVVKFREAYRNSGFEESIDREAEHARHIVRDHGLGSQFGAADGDTCGYCEKHKVMEEKRAEKRKALEEAKTQAAKDLRNG